MLDVISTLVVSVGQLINVSSLPLFIEAMNMKIALYAERDSAVT